MDTDVAIKSSSWASNNLAEGLPITLFLTLLRVETLTVWTVIVWVKARLIIKELQRRPTPRHNYYQYGILP